MIRVVSTGFNAPTKERCIASIRSQRLNTRHGFFYHYLDAGLQKEPWPAMRNKAAIVFGVCDPGDIVVELDGDDWFAHESVLQEIHDLYEASPQLWVTYGSFVFADGRPADWQQAYQDHEDIRRAPWRASHLKTYRATLFHRINVEREFIRPDGTWREHARDLAVMFPILEMAGPEHRMWCPEIRYVYNLSSSFERNADIRGLVAESDDVAAVRALPAYARLEKL